MNTSRFLKTTRPGIVMPLAIIVVVLLVALGTALLSLGLQGQVLGIRAGEAISARAAADAALTKAAMAMSQAGLIHENEQATLADLFRREPDKALESLVKVAEAKKRPASIPSLGAPVESGKNRTGSERESDRVLYQRLGLSH